MKLKKLLYMLPVAMLFVSPWFHKLLYLNLTSAWPDISDKAAHVLCIIGSIISAFWVGAIANPSCDKCHPPTSDGDYG